MFREQLERMSVDELWEIHSLINDILATKIIAKKNQLQKRLELLGQKENEAAQREN